MEDLIFYVVESVVEFFSDDRIAGAITFVRAISLGHELKQKLTTKDDVTKVATEPPPDEEESEVTASDKEDDEET